MRERMGVIGPIAALAGVLGVCCGLPVLLSLGALGAFAGASMQSWALVAVGLVLVVAGGVRWTRHRSSAGTTCDLSVTTSAEPTNTTPAADATHQGDKL